MKVTSWITEKSFFPAVAAAVILAAAGLLLYSAAAAEGARNGLALCTAVLIPSLFPFMVLSAFVVKSGLSAIIGRHIEPVTRFLFRLPGVTGATILMSMIGGYPAGARGVRSLYQMGEITEEQAARLLCFTVGAGPAFVISVVGAGLLKSSEAGFLLLVSQMLGSIVIGIISGLFSKNEALPPKSGKKEAVKKAELTTAFIDAAADSARAMMSMCAFVVLFSTFISLFDTVGFTGKFSSVLSSLGLPKDISAALLPVLLEVTRGCRDAAALHVSPAFLAFAIGWAGACVHFQIMASVTDIKFSRVRFLFFRLLHGLAAAVITDLLFLLFPNTIEVFSTVTAPLVPQLSSPAPGCAALILVCALFLLSLPAKGLEIRKKKC